MTTKKQEIDSSLQGEIDLTYVIIFLWTKKVFIFSFTLLFTLISLIYAINLPTLYKTSVSIVLPSTKSMVLINTLPGIHLYNYSEEDEAISKNISLGLFSPRQLNKKSVFSRYIDTISSLDFQKKVFFQGNYLEKFNVDNIQIINKDSYVISILSTFNLLPPDTNIKDIETGLLNQKPYIAQMIGIYPEVISEYLNDLTTMGNTESINQILQLDDVLSEDYLAEMIRLRDSLLFESNERRLKEINRVKERNEEKIRSLLDEMQNEREIARIKTKNEIVFLTDQYEIAKSLDAFENNFISIDPSAEAVNYPTWFLFGSKSIKKTLEMLKSRTDVDSYIPKLNDLARALAKAQNNTYLESLIIRQDDSLIDDKFVEIDRKILNIKEARSNPINPDSFTAAQIRSPASSESLPGSKKGIVILTFLLSLVASIVWVSIGSVIRSSNSNNI